MTQQTVGFVGLGRMGGAMAKRLAAAGVALVVHDVDERRLVPLAAIGAACADSIGEVADRAQVVFSCLPTAQLSLELALGPISTGAAVQTYVDTGTIGIDTAHAIADGLPGHIGFVDAPVSGGPNGARDGTLTVIASGPVAAFTRTRDYLAMIAGQVFHVGERAGQAQLVKLINNHLSAAGRLAAFEGLVMGMKAGIDPVQLLDVLNAGTGRNHTTSHKIPAAIRSGEFAYGARLANSIKDESLLLEAASELGVPLWLPAQMLATLNAAAQAGHPDHDSMSVLQYMGEQAGVDARAILEGRAP